MFTRDQFVIIDMTFLTWLYLIASVLGYFIGKDWIHALIEATGQNDGDRSPRDDASPGLIADFAVGTNRTHIAWKKQLLICQLCLLFEH